MADDKNVGKLHVEITGDSKNLKKAAKEGVESLKEVEKTVDTTDSSSSFSKLKASLEGVKTVAQSSTAATVSKMREMGSAAAATASSIKNAFIKNPMNMNFKDFETSLQSMDASKLKSTLVSLQANFKQLSAEAAKAETVAKSFARIDMNSAETKKATAEFRRLQAEANKAKTRIALVRDVQDELGKKKLDRLIDQHKKVGDAAEKAGKRTSMISALNIRQMLRFSGILLGMRSIYGVISRSVRSYMEHNQQLNATLQGASYSLGQVLGPAIEVAVAGFVRLVAWLGRAASFAMTLMNVLFGTKFAIGQVGNSAKSTAKGIGQVAKAAKDANKKLAGFDDLNAHSSDKDSGSGGGGGGGAGEIAPIPVKIDNSGLGEFEKGLVKLIDLLKVKFKPALDIFKSIDFNPIKTSITNLWGAVKPILATMGETLVWLTNNVVAPFIKFFIERIAPVGLDLITAALKILHPVLVGALEFGKQLWDLVLAPIAGWVADKAVATLEWLASVLGDIGDWMAENQGTVSTIVTIIGSLAIAWGLVNAALAIWNIVGLVATGITTGLAVAAGALSAAIAFITSPIGIAIAAIGAIIAIGLLLHKHWDEIMLWFKTTWDNFKIWVSNAVSAASAAISNFITGAKTLFTNMANNIFGALGPIGAYWKGILGGILTETAKIIEKVKGIFKGITTFVSGVFSGDWKKAWQGVKQIFKGIVDTLGAIFKAPINVIISGINGFLGGINKIKIPNWVPGVGGKGFSFSPINFLAKGGTVSGGGGANAIIGEGRYDEAVVPLGQSPQFRGMKQDIASQVIDALSNIDMGGSGSDQPIILNIDGETFAKAVVKHVNKRSAKVGRTELII